MTDAELIAVFRRQVLAHAEEHGNVSDTCRQFGVSRKTFYKWRGLAAAYGPEGLLPKTRRQPAMPNATPTHVIERLLTHAVNQPTLGARGYADLLDGDGFVIAASTVQNHLNRHGLGRREQRIARAAAIQAAVTGMVTDAARGDDSVFGRFCHFAAGPGDLVAIDAFYIGNLKGVGRCYQLTAVDVATRWAMVWIVAGPVNSRLSIQFITKVIAHFADRGVTVRAVVTDNGAEFIAGAFRARLAQLCIDHHRIPPRSPNHNAVVERFQGTMLHECWRRAFHRRRFTSIRQLQAEADAWLQTYNTRRRNHGDYMRGRTPAQMLSTLTDLAA